MGENGIIIVNKGQDMTSHDCVNMVRKALKIKRVGHTGTLDPMATGVLPICIGKATKVADEIAMGDKRYTAEFELGYRTDTQDITGKKIFEAVPNCTKDDIETVIDSFLGEQFQTPPMYSAKKVNGKKLYELARKGIEIEREPVVIEIKKIDILKNEKNKVTIDVICTKGTYIRTLIDDIGLKLGCGATMTSLIRTACGIFTIDSNKLIDIAEVKKQNQGLIINNLISVDKLYSNKNQLILAYNLEMRFRNGIYLTLNELGLKKDEISENQIFRIYNTVGEFLALGIMSDDQRDNLVLKVYKSFY